MLAADSATTQLGVAQIVDYVVFGLGLAWTIGVVVYMRASGRWRNPLAETGVLASHVPASEAGAIACLAFFITYLSMWGVARATASEAPLQTGEHAWFVAQIAAAFVSLGAAAALMLLARRLPLLAPVARRPFNGLRLLKIAVGGVLVFSFVGSLQQHMARIVLAWLGAPDPEHPVLLDAIRSDVDVRVKLMLLFSAVVVAPLTEELLFRGVVFHALCRSSRSPWLAIAVTGTVFGLIHFPVPSSVLPLCTFGFILGYIRVRSRSLTACVLTHALFNLKTMLLAFADPTMVAG